jgi:DNA-3-methyladenine glycosylase I
MTRCEWARGSDPEMMAYHDEEWGVPSRDDVHLFELLVLEGAQAGLSWATILKKRAGYRRAFAGFDVRKIARYDDDDVARLLGDPGIVRNRAKIESTLANARAVLALHEDFGSLSDYLWGFVDGKPVVNSWRKMSDLPAETPTSKTMSRELKRRGFRFIGPTTCYAFMQAAGLVNDHVVGCFRRREILT